MDDVAQNLIKFCRFCLLFSPFYFVAFCLFDSLDGYHYFMKSHGNKITAIFLDICMHSLNTNHYFESGLDKFYLNWTNWNQHATDWKQKIKFTVTATESIE